MNSDTVKSAAAVTGAFLLVLATGTLGWVFLRGTSGQASATWHAAAGVASDVPTPTPDVVPTTAAPTPTPTPTNKSTPAKKKVVPKTTATSQPPDKQQPPTPVLKTEDPSCQPTKSGPDAAIGEVKAALVAAANRKYWDGVVPDPALTVARPAITVPVDLMKAVAWQESGWQSAIVACDGGVGVMQIQVPAGTDDFVNLRFGESFDVYSLSDNASIGAAYLEWLIMWFGIRFYDQNFDLSVVAPVGPNGEQIALLDVVLAAYNIGYGGVIVSMEQHTLSIPTRAMQYVNNVKALRTSCVCQKY